MVADDNDAVVDYGVHGDDDEDNGYDVNDDDAGDNNADAADWTIIYFNSSFNTKYTASFLVRLLNHVLTGQL